MAATRMQSKARELIDLAAPPGYENDEYLVNENQRCDVVTSGLSIIPAFVSR